MRSALYFLKYERLQEECSGGLTGNNKLTVQRLFLERKESEKLLLKSGELQNYVDFGETTNLLKRYILLRSFMCHILWCFSKC